MWTAIAFAEACAATLAACAAIISREGWQHRARCSASASNFYLKQALGLQHRVSELNAECDLRIADITKLSAELDKIRNHKPGPQKRAAQRAQILSKAAELRSEVTA